MTAFPPLNGFRSEKAAQIAAYFLRDAGGHMEKLALIKLIYISERESVRRRGRPMIFDELYSLKDGPICSSALNGINGVIDPEVWSEYIVLDGKRDVHLVRGLNESQDQLSTSDRAVLDFVISEHRGKTSSQLRNWTHDAKNVPEYVEVESGRVPIGYDQVAEAVGQSSIDVLGNIEIYRKLESLFLTK